MKDSQKSYDAIRQNEIIVKKTHCKHDANLQKNTTLYFQIGLILSLLMVYTAFEMEFETVIPQYSENKIHLDVDDLFVIPNVKPYEEVVKTEVFKAKKNAVVLTPETKIKIKQNQILKQETALISTPLTTHTNEGDPDLTDFVEEPDDVDYSILSVQNVPVYPGCETATTNEARRLCMSKKISRHISKTFNSAVAENSGLSGLMRINVMFKINKEGKVEVLKTRAPHPSLEKEAKRVILKLPKMTPGLVNNKSVNVLYNIPIVFKTE